MIPLEYPAVLGSPVGGVVQALGEGVTKVKVGDRIVCGTKIFTQKKAKYGGMQRYTLVDEFEVIEVCASLKLSIVLEIAYDTWKALTVHPRLETQTSQKSSLWAPIPRPVVCLPPVHSICITHPSQLNLCPPKSKARRSLSGADRPLWARYPFRTRNKRATP